MLLLLLRDKTSKVKDGVRENPVNGSKGLFVLALP